MNCKMVRDNFLQRKNDVLNKLDKSSVGGWDDKIKPLCKKINELDDFYTTSSCSGRIIVMADRDKKGPGLFEFTSHNNVNFNELNKFLSGNLKGDLKFKSEPPIIHVCCRTLDSAEKILNFAQNAGWKRSGIISLGRFIVVEMVSTEKIEFPLINRGDLLVDKNFLKIVLEKANSNLKKGWLKIAKLEKMF